MSYLAYAPEYIIFMNASQSVRAHDGVLRKKRMTGLKNKGAIVGIGETAVGKLPTMSSTGIQLEAIRLALKDGPAPAFGG